MFVREKRIRGYTYLYLVETVGEAGHTKQRVAKNLSRKNAVAERGMISAETIDSLKARGLEYVPGVRERTDKWVRDVVLDDATPFTPPLVERARGETQLFVKEVVVRGRRYIVCRNEAEAEKDRADRQAIVDGLARQLERGDKALIGNSAYRRYLRATDRGHRAFEIDPGKLADEARYEGIFVLRTNARIPPLQAVLRYRDLMQVEELFKTAKALPATLQFQTPASGAWHQRPHALAGVEGRNPETPRKRVKNRNATNSRNRHLTAHQRRHC
nr:hypothetical protein [Ferruginivarius sediminum]